MRPLCISCQQRPAAINYRKGKKIFYRKKCERCVRKGPEGIPKWFRLGYRAKDHCEKCGYSSSEKSVFNVYHIDGDLENCRPSNLKTICANCQRILQKQGSKWRQGDLTPDF
jgi:hypothetical protein